MLIAMKKPAQQDIDAALRLVQLVADPEACRARLAELMAATDTANSAINEANAKLAAVDARDQAAVMLTASANALVREAKDNAAAIEAAARQVADETAKARALLEADRRNFATAATETQRQLADKSAGLDAREAVLAKRQSDLDSQFATREADLAAKTQALDVREAEVKVASDLANALREQYQGKLAALRNMAA